jgi:TPR repeat protein
VTQDRFLVLLQRMAGTASWRRSILLIALGILAPNMACAAPADADLQAGLSDYQLGAMAKARQEFQRAAMRGEPIAEFNLASMLVQGEGGAVNPKQGRFWLRRAANAGLAEAQYALGVLYDRGDGLKRSAPLAAHWYRLAAEQGDIDAAMALATQYFVGRGVPLDYAAAAHWYEVAAQAGVVPAQYILASCYEHGDGVPRDITRAIYWYQLAGNSGDALAADKARTLSEGQAASGKPT